MDPLRSEEEQLEALKHWWEENGKTTIATVVLVIAGWGGWDFWQDRVAAHKEAGSAAFAQLQTLVAPDELSEVQEASIPTISEQLQTEFADLGYANLASLELAKFHMGRNEYADAVAVLEALNFAEMREELRYMAQLRLARAQWSNGDSEAALATLDSAQPGAFSSLFEELRGDIALSNGYPDLAREHYIEAKQQAEAYPQMATEQRMAFLDMKAESLATPEQDAGQ